VSMRASYEKKIQAQLDELRIDIEKLKTKAIQMETNLQLEYYTQIEELQLKLAAAEKKFELLRQVHDDSWETFKTDLEQSWKSLRELIKAITSP